VHEMSKSENANKAENVEYIFCKKPFWMLPMVTGVWNGHMKIVVEVTYISRSLYVTYILLRFYFCG
jgi:hypothetical protein